MARQYILNPPDDHRHYVGRLADLPAGWDGDCWEREAADRSSFWMRAWNRNQAHATGQAASYEDALQLLKEDIAKGGTAEPDYYDRLGVRVTAAGISAKGAYYPLSGILSVSLRSADVCLGDCDDNITGFKRGLNGLVRTVGGLGFLCGSVYYISTSDTPVTGIILLLPAVWLLGAEWIRIRLMIIEIHTAAGRFELYRSWYSRFAERRYRGQRPDAPLHFRPPHDELFEAIQEAVKDRDHPTASARLRSAPAAGDPRDGGTVASQAVSK